MELLTGESNVSFTNLGPMNNRLLSLLVLLFVAFPGSVIADSLKTRIAVLDFSLRGEKFATDELGAMVAEWLVTALVKDGRFEVIERALLKKLIAEQQLGVSGAIDDSSASMIGKILGVKDIITGSVLNLGVKLDVNARIINVEDGTISTAESVKCLSDKELQRAIEELTARMVKNFPLTGFVVKKDSGSVIIDLGMGTGVQTGMEFSVYKEGKQIIHPKTGEVIDVEQLSTGRIKVSQIHGNVATASILSEDPEGIEYGQLVRSIQDKKKLSPVAVKEAAPEKPVKAKEVQLVDSPVYDESGKGALQKEKKIDRPLPPNGFESHRQIVALPAVCQDLLKSWQLGDASVMQRYLKECSR